MMINAAIQIQLETVGFFGPFLLFPFAVRPATTTVVSDVVSSGSPSPFSSTGTVSPDTVSPAGTTTTVVSTGLPATSVSKTTATTLSELSGLTGLLLLPPEVVLSVVPPAPPLFCVGAVVGAFVGFGAAVGLG